MQPHADDPTRWIPLDDGSALALHEGKLVARNKKGKALKSVSKKLRTSPQGEQLQDVARLLAAHRRECLETVEGWMLRSLPVPLEVIAAVWADPIWRELLDNTVVRPGPGSDEADDPELTGFLRQIDPERGAGLVNLDGESVWTKPTTLALPHPILLEELADFRELAAELGIEQRLGQLMRETFDKPAGLSADDRALEEYAGAAFEELRHAIARARAIGCRMSGGFAVTTVWEDAQLHAARFWLGAEDPECETETAELEFLRGDTVLPLVDVPPVTWSEGVRMASLIHAARKVEDKAEA
jgi:hypothetical protein